MKRLTALLLALVLTLGIFPTTAFAAATEEEALGEVDIYHDGAEMSYLSINGRVRTQVFTYYNHVNAKGQSVRVPAYCVNPNTAGVPQTVPAGTGIEYLANERATDPKIMGIVASGYPTRSLERLGLASEYEAYYATKMALWCYLLPNWDIADLVVNSADPDQTAAKRVLAAAKLIYTDGMYWDEILTPKITAVADQEKAYPVTFEGKEYYQQLFTVTSETWVSGGVIYIGFADPSSVPEGTRIVGLSGNDITGINAVNATEGGFSGQFKILYPVESIEGQSGNVQLTFTADTYKYAIFYATCAETDKYGNIQNYMCDTDPLVPMEVDAYSTYGDADPPDTPDTPEEPSTEPGSLKIVKLEAGTEIPLSGAVFEVVGPNGDTIGSFSTDASGTIQIPEAEPGSYTVYERIPPKDHLISEISVQNVTVQEGQSATVTFENQPYGDLRVEKFSNTGEGLEGVQIQIKHIESGRTYSGTTEPGGAVQFTGLLPGAYEVREIAGIKGWIADTETVKTVAVVSGQTSTVSFTNQELPGLRIEKYDRITKEAMSGVTFRIWRDGELLGDFTTGQLGEIVLVEQQPGTYLVQEVESDDEHIVETTPQQVELKAGDGIKQLVFFNDKKPGIHLIKVDSADLSKPIANAKFCIEAVDGSFGPEEYTTDDNGVIDLSKLPAGAYVVTELECPGYIIDSAQRIIQLDGNETAQFIFTNSIKPTLQLIKLSSDSSRLAGVTFRIAKIEDGSHYLDRTTNAQGEISISDLESGVYSVKETATTADHIIDLREYHVELFPGKTSTLVIENQKRPNLIVYKRDADTGEPIANTVFLVEAADGHSVDEIKTDADGRAELKNLLPGVYEITEKSVPSAYLLDAPSQLVTLYPNRDHTVYFENHKKPNLTVNKIDSITGDPIKGAKFQVTYASNNTTTGEVNELGTFFTDENGQFILETLRDGWYKVTELEPAAGYAIKEPAVQEVYIKGGESKALTFENMPLSAIVIKKVDADSGAPLEGAWFRIRFLGGTSGTGGTTIGEYQTSSNGTIVVTGLDAGTYIVEEISAPNGYVINDSAKTVYLSGKDQDVITVVFGNDKMGSLLIVKKDAVTGDPLSDVEFLVTNSDGGVIGNANGKYVTDSAGTIRINELEPGITVIVKEIRTKSGYVLDDTPQSIKIKANETMTLEFRNQPKGGLIIQKVDSATREPLAGVQFKITAASGELVADNEGMTSSNGLYVTDENGQIVLNKLQPGTYVVTETASIPGYILDSTPQTVVVNAGDTQTLTFTNDPMGNLIIHKLDSLTKEPLAGVQFKITYADGKVVDAEGGKLSSNGLYYTDENGQIKLSGLTGTLVVTEVQTIEGYTIDENTRTQTVVVNPDDTQTLTFYNTPVGGLQMIKTDEDSGERVSNCTFEIRRLDDGLIGTYTTDANGTFSVPLDEGSYYAVEIKANENYQLDATPHYFEIKNGETTVLRVTNKRLSGIIIHKIDSVTEEGIYGVKFVLYDANRKPIGEYTTDNEGYIYIDEILGGSSGRFYIRELEAAEGYELDKEYKTVYVQPGKTVHIEWKNTPITGQIQIYKYAAEYNEVTGTAPGTPLQGAVYEITNARSGKVVDYITTDARGVAASKALPLGRYKIVEVTTPAYWQIDPTVHDVTLEYAGQIIKLSAYDKPAELGVTLVKTGIKQVLAGSKMTYRFKVSNDSNVPLEQFFLHDKIPYDVASASALTTGTYSHRLTYRILYKTNYNDYRVLASNLLSKNNYSFALSALPLMAGEVVTDIYFDFGTVPVGFQNTAQPTLTVSVSPKAVNGYYVTNRADAGGFYQGTWETANSSWVAIVRNLTPIVQLPKTGY